MISLIRSTLSFISCDNLKSSDLGFHFQNDLNFINQYEEKMLLNEKTSNISSFPTKESGVSITTRFLTLLI